MTNIIVALPKIEDAKGIKNLLVRGGFQVTGVCTTGAQTISVADELNDGIVICSYKLVGYGVCGGKGVCPPGL